MMNTNNTALPPSTRWAQTYKEFDSLLQRLDLSMKGVIPGCLGYSSEALRRRLVQKLADALLSPYLRESALLYKNGRLTFPGSEGPARVGAFWILTQGEIPRPAWLFIFRSLFRFALQWLLVLTAALRRKQEGPLAGPVTIFFGMPEAAIAGPKMEGFVAFCKKGPVTPLQQVERLLIQGIPPAGPRPAGHPFFSKRPLFALNHIRRRGWKHTARFLMDHLLALSAFLRLVARTPAACLLGKDFAYHSLVLSLNRDQLIGNIVITNSDYANQGLWMIDLPGRCFQTHMTWYSMNSQPFSFRDYPVSVVFPLYRYMAIDHHWVWTQNQGNWLRELHPSTQTHVVGPILWVLPEARLLKQEEPEASFRIGVFDVTPAKPEWEKNFGLVYNYYRTDTMMAFVDSIAAAVQELESRMGMPISIEIKHKRNPTPIHDRTYIDHIAELQSAGRLRVTPPDANLFLFTSRCDLVVVIPYSSPAYVAACQGTPAVYYDPSSTLEPRQDMDPLIRFAGNQRELVDAIAVQISEKTRGQKGADRCAS
ncbi:MAG: polysaccharide biosynthesis PFTS motif protein [Elusimicrobiota bacterium]|jgi:hypothetical protein